MSRIAPSMKNKVQLLLMWLNIIHLFFKISVLIHNYDYALISTDWSYIIWIYGGKWSVIFDHI